MTNDNQANLCHHCGAAIHAIDGRVGRSESCDSCRYDLHVCLNCKHYDRASYNECREPMADRVVDKDRRNFCDYFALGRAAAGKGDDEKAAALKKLDDLFK
ncbi:MAG: hypothetical protein U0136_02110 [Bdellovibrionota bacterium]